jgi:hypothetical protein
MMTKIRRRLVATGLTVVVALISFAVFASSASAGVAWSGG